MDTSKLLMVAGLGVGGYLAYRWYAGPGGYADQQACTAGGEAANAGSLPAVAAAVWQAAAAAKYSSALDFIAAKEASDPNMTTTIAGRAGVACWRVAVTQYPSLALATAAAVSPVSTAAAVPATSATSAGAVVPVTSATPAAVAAPVVASPTIDTIYQGLVSPTGDASVSISDLDIIYEHLWRTAKAAGVNLTAGTANGQPVDPNGWNYFLASVYSLPNGAALPGGLFPASAQSQPMSLPSYWAVMAPWLQSNVAGIGGLGIYGGLGALVRAYR